MTNFLVISSAVIGGCALGWTIGMFQKLNSEFIHLFEKEFNKPDSKFMHALIDVIQSTSKLPKCGYPKYEDCVRAIENPDLIKALNRNYAEVHKHINRVKAVCSQKFSPEILEEAYTDLSKALDNLSEVAPRLSSWGPK